MNVSHSLADFLNAVTGGLNDNTVKNAVSSNAKLINIFNTAAANDDDKDDSKYTTDESGWKNLVNEKNL